MAKNKNSRISFKIILILLVWFGSFFVAFTPQKAMAVAKTWDGGCGANTNWSCAANWSDDIVPAAADTLTFNATSTNNSTVDTLFNATETVSTITIAAGYTGTITMATTLHVSGLFSQAAGTFTASNQTLDMNGGFTLSAGVFTASSGSTTLAGAMTISGSPTFNANGGTFTFDGTTAATLSCNSVTFNLVTFTHNNVSKVVSSNCNMPLGNNPTVGGNTTATVTLNGAFSGTGTLTTLAGFTVNSTAPLSGFTDITSNVVNISGGSFTAPSGVFTVNSTFTINVAATFDANGGTVTFASTTAAVLSCGGKTFNLVTFTHQNVAKTVSSDCSLPLGNNPTIGSNLAADLTLAGTLSGTGTVTIGTANAGNVLTLQTGAVFSGFSSIAAGLVTVSSGTIDLSSVDTLTVASTFTVSAGSITLPSTSATFSGTVTVSSGATLTMSAGTSIFNAALTINSGAAMNHNDGTVEFGGTTTVTIACGNKVFNLVTFTHTSNTKTVSSDCSLPLGNNPTIGSGTTADLTLAGTLSGTGTLTIGTASSGNVAIFNSTAALLGFSGFASGTTTVTGATLDFSSYSTFTMGSAYSQTGGTVTMPTIGASFPSTFTVNTGSTFTASSGTTTFASTFTFNSGATFNANGGTVNFSGGTATLSCGNATFNLATFTHTGNTVKTITSTCSLPLGNNPTLGGDTNADITLAGTLSGTGTVTIGDTGSGNLLTLQTGAVFNGFSGIAAGILTVSSGTIDLSAIDTLTVARTFNVSAGSITLPSTSATFTNAATVSSGATLTMSAGTTIFNAALTISSGANMNNNGGTVEFGGSASATIACGNKVFNLVVFNHISGTKTVSNDCIMPLGIDPTLGAGGNVTLFGTLSGSGTLTTTGTFTISVPGTLSGFNGLNASSLTISGTAIVNLGTYNTLDVNSNFAVTGSSTFTATSANMTVGGDFTVESGSTFNHNNGTVILDGNDQSITGAITFSNLNKTVASSATLTFPAGSLQTIQGTLTLKGGDAANLLSLVSSVPGSYWQIDAQGTRDIRYVNVVDSTNINGGSPIIAYDSVDGGNNINWLFESTPTPPGPTPTPTPTPVTPPSYASIYSPSTPDTSGGLATYLEPSIESEENEEKQLDIYPEPNEPQSFITSVVLYLLGFGIFTLLVIWLILALKKRKKDEDTEPTNKTK